MAERSPRPAAKSGPIGVSTVDDSHDVNDYLVFENAVHHGLAWIYPLGKIKPNERPFPDPQSASLSRPRA